MLPARRAWPIDAASDASTASDDTAGRRFRIEASRAPPCLSASRRISRMLCYLLARFTYHCGSGVYALFESRGISSAMISRALTATSLLLR